MIIEINGVMDLRISDRFNKNCTPHMTQWPSSVRLEIYADKSAKPEEAPKPVG